jgi:hypothetical protein
MYYKQLLDIHNEAMELKNTFNNHLLKYIYVEDEHSIIIKLNGTLLKIPDVDYYYINKIYENINLDNCVFVDADYLDKIIDNMLR